MTYDPAAMDALLDAADVDQLVRIAEEREAAYEDVDPFTAWRSRLAGDPRGALMPVAVGALVLGAFLLFTPSERGRR